MFRLEIKIMHECLIYSSKKFVFYINTLFILYYIIYNLFSNLKFFYNAICAHTILFMLSILIRGNYFSHILCLFLADQGSETYYAFNDTKN